MVVTAYLLRVRGLPRITAAFSRTLAAAGRIS